MPTEKQLAVGAGSFGLLGLVAINRQGEDFDLAGLRAAYQAKIAALREELEEGELALPEGWVPTEAVTNVSNALAAYDPDEDDLAERIRIV